MKTSITTYHLIINGEATHKKYGNRKAALAAFARAAKPKRHTPEGGDHVELRSISNDHGTVTLREVNKR